MEKMLTVKQVSEGYGLSVYQARNLMIRAGRVNIGQSEDYPRWAVPASRLDAYLAGKEETSFTGLDSFGKLLRR